MKPISIVIITYNRPADALELVSNLSALQNASSLLQDVILVNNASTEDYTSVKQFKVPEFPLQYIDAPENLGVTKGRNFALQFAQGDIIIFLDDDAVLQNSDALNNTLKAFSSPGYQQRPVGIVSFKVLYYENLQMQVNALPHKKFKDYKNKSEFFTYYFAGGAHAIKRRVLADVGNLPDDFFYGMEEYDLSYRIIDKGYCIKYDSSIVMLHKESPLGRKPKNEKLKMMWVNKSKVAYRYLPDRYFYSTAFMWSLEYLKQTNMDFSGWLSGWKAVIQIIKNETKTKLMPSTLQYLKEVQARLWY